MNSRDKRGQASDAMAGVAWPSLDVSVWWTTNVAAISKGIIGCCRDLKLIVEGAGRSLYAAGYAMASGTSHGRE